MSKVDAIKKGLADRTGESHVSLSNEDVNRLGLLLEEKTYFDAAKRAGVSESAIKQTMSRLQAQHEFIVTPLYKVFEAWKAERKRFKKGPK